MYVIEWVMIYNVRSKQIIQMILNHACYNFFFQIEMIKVNLKSISDHLIEMYEIFTTEKNTFGNVIRDVLEKENMIMNIIKQKYKIT